MMLGTARTLPLPRWLGGNAAQSQEQSPHGAHREPHAGLSPWRAAVLTEAERLADELARVPATSRGSQDHEIAERAINVARALGRARAPHSVAVWRSLTCQRSTQCVSSAGAWAALHRADEALVMVESQEACRARAAELRADLDDSLDVKDPRIAVYRASLGRVSKKAASVTRADREALRAIQRTVNEHLASAHQNLKSFRKVIIDVTWWLTLAVLMAGGLGALDPEVFSTCSDKGCPHLSGAGSMDVFEIALVGGLGGLVSAVLTIRKLAGFNGPFGLYTAQAMLKVPMGAALALIGVLLLQRGLLGPVKPEPGERVFAYAALFGFSQQLITQLVDRQAATLIGGTRGKDDPAPR